MRKLRIRKVLLFAIGIATFLGLIAWSGPGAIIQAFRAVLKITPSSWIILIFLMATMMIIHGLKWFCLLAGGDQKPHLRDMYPILFFAYFVNQFAPLRPGAPLRGVLGARKLAIPFSLSILAILIEQGLDVLVTGTLALPSISILSSSGIHVDTRVLLLMILGAFCILGLFILWWDGFVRFVSKVLLKALPNDMSTQLLDPDLSPTKSISQSYIFGSFVLTMAYWIVRFELFITILRLVNISIGFTTAATIISVSFLVSVLSMIPGGWGVKESVITMLLVGLGIDKQTATAAAFLDRAVLLVFIFVLGGISSFILGAETRESNHTNRSNQKTLQHKMDRARISDLEKDYP